MSNKSRRKVKKKSKKELLKERLILISVLASALGVFILGSYMLFANFPGPNLLSPDDERLMRGDSQFIGKQDADVTIVEFIDLACSACAKYNPLLKLIAEKYDDKVKLVIRHFPQEENSIVAAKAIEAAALQGCFVEMENLLLMRQEEWVSDESKVRAYLLERASELGLITSKFNEDLDSPTIAERIRRDRKDAEDLKLKTTPTFFVNGQKIQHPNGKKFVELIEKNLRHNPEFNHIK